MKTLLILLLISINGIAQERVITDSKHKYNGSYPDTLMSDAMRKKLIIIKKKDTITINTDAAKNDSIEFGMPTYKKYVIRLITSNIDTSEIDSILVQIRSIIEYNDRFTNDIPEPEPEPVKNKKLIRLIAIIVIFFIYTFIMLKSLTKW